LPITDKQPAVKEDSGGREDLSDMSCSLT